MAMLVYRSVASTGGWLHLLTVYVIVVPTVFFFGKKTSQIRTSPEIEVKIW